MSASDRSSEHPSDAVLATWLELGEPTTVEDHLSVCDQCSERLESLTDIGGLQDELATATRPPADLASRTTGGGKGRLAAQEAVSVVFDMLSLPFWTAAILIGGDDPGGVAVPPRPSGETSDDDGERTDG
jgi:hypothetical protein